MSLKEVLPLNIPESAKQLGQFRRLSIVLCFCALCGSFSDARAALTYFNNRPAFDLAHPNLPTETFEGGNIAPGTYALFTGPLNSSTANALFSPGSILPGLTVVDNPGPDVNDMVYVGAGTQPGVSKAVLTRPFNDSTDLLFAPAVPAVGFDFAAVIGPGVINFGSFTISIYGSSGLLGSQFISTPEALSFFGVDSSSDLITRVSVYDGAIHSELIDNVSFGISVPEPGLLPFLLTGFVISLASRKRTRRPSLS